ncbi:MAG TPA: hypothetical protein VFA40_06090 [Terriglobales bacterium]|nr:hypothetical protein [Terriglobales bacterium]
MPRRAPIPRLIRPLVPLISWLTARYIAYHRRRLLPQSMAIPDRMIARMRAFFPASVLAETRIVQARMPDPILYPLVRVFGIKGMLQMSSIGAITLLDVVAYPEELDSSTLFHELVHVVQYRVLGWKEFARLYVRGFLERGGYEGIPLERQAYQLGTRFDRWPQGLFSVEEEVIRWHSAGKL